MNRAVILITGLLLCLLGCENPRQKPLRDVWSYIKERPDSALTTLEQYSVEGFTRRKDKAEYALLKSIALDKNYIDLTSDSLIRVALDYYDVHGSPRQKMFSWFYLARVQFNARDYNQAIVSLERAEDYLKQCDEPYYEGLIHMTKSAIYTNTHNKNEALSESVLGNNAFIRIKEDNQARIARIRVGLNYMALRNYAPADSCYLSVINDPEANTSQRAESMFHYALSLVFQNKYQEALIWYKAGFQEDNRKIRIESIGAYAYTLIKNGYIEQGKAVFDKLKDIKEGKNQYLWFHYLYEEDKGNYIKALDEYRELVQIQDSIAINTMEQSIIKTQRDYLEENAKVLTLQSEKRQLAIYLISVCSVLCFFLLIGIIILIKRRSRQKEEFLLAAQEEARHLLQQANADQAALEDQLALSRRQFISAYKKRFSKIAHLSETYYKTSDHKGSRDLVYAEVQSLASFISQDAHTYRQLERNVNANLSNAMSLYRKDFPGKEESEYRFVCYLMAGFPASTINLITNLSTSNIYVRKTRLIESIKASESLNKDWICMVLEG